jgi:hypothetical protein
MENVTEASRLFPRKMQKDEKLGEWLMTFPPFFIFSWL